ncbi:MAG: hypothetical protein OHK0013_17080 [Sandaracinaceae bacterium]
MTEDITTEETLHLPRREHVPVPALRAEVVEGPDRGAVTQNDHEVLRIGVAEGNDLRLSDPTVSRFHVTLTRTDDGILVEDKRSKNRTRVGDILVDRVIVPPGTILALGGTRVRVGAAPDVEIEMLSGDELAGLRARTPTMRRLFARLRRAAASDVSVLVRGESGTGKEGFARAIHDLGPRASRPFVTVDCASLSPTLVASELFGHEKGAFTGADRRYQGAFERADGGTLFLDEIGELPEELQPTLLGALERKRFRRLGGRDEISVDVRVVCATHRDLHADVNSGRFRLDLFYRVAVVTLEIPPLRERLDDIPLLIEHFVRQGGDRRPLDAIFAREVLEAFRRHDWPGNVRELRNVVEATLAMGEAPRLAPTEAFGKATPAMGTTVVSPPTGVRQSTVEQVLDLPYRDARNRVLGEFELAYVRHLLAKAGQNVSQAARLGEMDRSHLWELVKRHRLR